MITFPIMFIGGPVHGMVIEMTTQPKRYLFINGLRYHRQKVDDGPALYVFSEMPN